MIAALLAELRDLLPAGPFRGRVLLEAEDHLRCAAGARIAAGMDPAAAEAEAVRAFGSPAEVARRIREDLGGRVAGRAAVLGLAMLGILAAVYALLFTEVATDLGPPRWWPDVPVLAAVTLLGIEVAAVAGAVVLVRLLRHRGDATAGAVRAPLLRGVLVAAVSAAAAAVSGEVTALLHLAEVRASGLAISVAGLDAGVLLLGAVAAALSVRGLRIAPAAGPAPHLVEDAAALLPLGLEGRLAATARRWPRAAAFADLRGHPWRTCAGVAVLVALLETVGQAAAKGAGHALALGVLQGAAVVAAFLVAGPALGLRRG